MLRLREKAKELKICFKRQWSGPDVKQQAGPKFRVSYSKGPI